MISQVRLRNMELRNVDMGSLGSVGLATGRVAIGVVALLRPALMAWPWVGGAQASAPAGVVLGRALGGRDLALGAGALLAAWRGDERALRGWTLAGAFCDGVDALATAVSWRDLPTWGRLAVACAATGGAVLGGSTVVRAAFASTAGSPGWAPPPACG